MSHPLSVAHAIWLEGADRRVGLTAEGMVPFQRPVTPFSCTIFCRICSGPIVLLDCSRVFSSSMGFVMRVAMAPLADPAAIFFRGVGSVSAPTTVFMGAYMPRRKPTHTLEFFKFEALPSLTGKLALNPPARALTEQALQPGSACLMPG